MGKILVVDDDLAFRDSSYTVLSRDGHRVMTYPFGSKLQGLIQEQKPDLVLVHVASSDDQGTRLLKMLQDNPAWKVPGVAVCRERNPDLDKVVYQTGGLDVIDKDTPAQEFCERVNRLLAVKHRVFKEAQEIRNVKLLVVDDEAPVRELLGGYFERKGFRTFAAENGEKALMTVEKEKPDVVILDVTMPGMDGILTLKKIKQITPSATVIMACGVVDDKIMKQAADYGASAYVLKPLDLQYLEVLVMTKIMTGAAGQ